jgi:hypothetical protein
MRPFFEKKNFKLKNTIFEENQRNKHLKFPFGSRLNQSNIFNKRVKMKEILQQCIKKYENKNY